MEGIEHQNRSILESKIEHLEEKLSEKNTRINNLEYDNKDLVQQLKQKDQELNEARTLGGEKHLSTYTHLKEEYDNHCQENESRMNGL